MKIVKQFEDNIFLNKFIDITEFNKINDEPAYWLWGLGEDGNIYCQCNDFIDKDTWYLYKHIYGFSLTDISDMKRIVKEFGHLVIFT